MEGTPFGRYRLQHLIGRGGMGEVWRAYDTETHRVVAIKLLPEDVATDAEFVERFRREARIAAGLNSPNIVPIHNFGEIDGRLYVDMQVIEGRDLEAVLDDGPMRPERAVRIIEQVAAALRAAHSAGLVHRDVKPSNILLNADDFAYLIDFGLARADEDAGLTGTGHTVGTLTYMAPERYDTRPVDLRTDVYSLACVLYQCLTGRRPFDGEGTDQMLAHISTPPPRPTDVVPGVPRAFDAVIAAGMAKDPAARYQTITDFARAARAALTENRQAGPPPPTQPWRPPPAPRVGPASVVPKPAAPPRWKSRNAVVTAVCLVISLVAVSAAVITVLSASGQGNTATPTTTAGAAPEPTGTTTRVGDVTYGAQVDLPSEGLEKLRGLAVSKDGGVVGLCCRGMIFDIPDGADEVTRRRYDAASGAGIAIDLQGDVIVDGARSGVQRLNDRLYPTKLAFPPLDNPQGLAVDDAGAVYVVNLTDAGAREVWKLPADSAAVRLPFPPQFGSTVAVDSTGVVYVENQPTRGVLKLAPGSEQPTEVTLPARFRPYIVAVDGADALYVGGLEADGVSVYRYPAGAAEGERLPLDGADWTDVYAGMAVSAEGDVYVADQGRNRVVKLPRVAE